MISVDEALEKVLREIDPLPAEEVSLRQAHGRCLAQEIRAAADMPPFDRSAMDGYAIRREDVAGAPAELRVVEEIPAGHDPVRSVGRGEAARIMTGAALPSGADMVVMVERTERLDGGCRVRILDAGERGQHIRRAGEDLRAGSALLEPGRFLGAPEIALLAAEGRAKVRVGSVPGVAILPTGDELVPVDRTPRGSQIRETNSWLLATLLRRIGIEPRLLGIVPDEPEALGRSIREGLKSEILLVTGGVSMGEYDLVGDALKAAGCRAVFEKVAIQPGKPLFFGIVDDPRAVVFGLPGNPASSVVDFLVFVRPALRRMMGAPEPVEPLPAARLASSFRRAPGRRGYLPARVEAGPDGALLVRPVPSMGSADLVALGRANAFLVTPETESAFEEGVNLRVMLLDDPFWR
jgi:molybdopterin molybdotransferase